MNSSRSPRPDQMNPSHIQSANVQYWSNGVMISAQISNADARQMVVDGSAFVISAQAIGAIQDGQYNS